MPSTNVDEECMVTSKKSALEVKKSVYKWSINNLPVRKTKLFNLFGNFIPFLVRTKAKTHVEEPSLLTKFLSDRSGFK